ncbi:MAG: hypothetical protein ABW185_30250 [Sedimenticola sp.]
MNSINRQKMDRTVTFTCLDRGYPQPVDILSVLEKSDIPPAEIFSLCKTSPNEGNFSVAFKSLEVATAFAGLGVVCDDRYRFQLSALGKQIVVLRLHWLPDYYGNSYIENLFSQYGKLIDISRECNTYKGADIYNGVRKVVLEVDECGRKSIPHLLEFACGQKVLVTMAGRPPLCLKCREVGHVRRSCPGYPVHSFSKAVQLQPPSTAEQRPSDVPDPTLLPVPTPVPAPTSLPVLAPVPAPGTVPVPTPVPAAVPDPTLPPPPSSASLQSVVISPPLPPPPSDAEDEVMSPMENTVSQGKKRGRDTDFITPNRVAKKAPAPESDDIQSSNMFAALFPLEAGMDSDGGEAVLVMDLPNVE